MVQLIKRPTEKEQTIPMKITAIVLDGFHKGHVVRMEYMKTLKLLQPRTIQVDYCCDYPNSVVEPIAKEIEYKECFRAVDGDVVFYSQSGKSMDFIGWFEWNKTRQRWNEFTTLYMGYHDEPIQRKDDGTQKTDYERGFERGIEEGRIMEAKATRFPYGK